MQESKDPGTPNLLREGSGVDLDARGRLLELSQNLRALSAGFALGAVYGEYPHPEATLAGDLLSMLSSVTEGVGDQGVSSSQSQRGRNGIAPRSPIERLLARLSTTETGCHEWTGALDRKGYARIAIGGQRNALAHRVAYEATKGPVPEGLVLDHLCRNRRCCNPAHLEPVTLVENTKRGWAARPAATHCKKGHPYEPGNVYREPRTGRRHCMICRGERNARRVR